MIDVLYGTKFKPVNLSFYDRIWIDTSWWSVSFNILCPSFEHGPSTTWNQQTLGLDGIE